MVGLDADLQWQASPCGRAGRPAVFSNAAIQLCPTLKCMFGLGLRQATGLAPSLIELARLDWRVPDYSSREGRRSQAIVVRGPKHSNLWKASCPCACG